MQALNERNLRSRFFALLRRKSAIEAEIRDELKRPLPCSLMLQRLKRQRLQMKDRMQAIGRTPQVI